MKSNKLRVIIPLCLLLLAGIGFALHTGWGTLSAIGWKDISILCPLGALGTMLASKVILPRPLISLAIAIVAIVILGRAFCGWVCPAPVIERLRTLFKRQDSPAKDRHDGDGEGDAIKENTESESDPEASSKNLKAEGKRHGAKAGGGACAACGKCLAPKPSNSRHIVLGGALLSAAIFGFPVFCLVCPIGLSFAFVFVLIMLFGGGDVTWSVILIPVMLLLELVFFRKWCSHICPLSSLMSLIGKLNRTFRPSIDDEKCLESAHGAKCGRCADVCEVAIDPRHPELGASMNECIRCRKCVQACPGNAITIPFLAKSGKSGKASLQPKAQSGGEKRNVEDAQAAEEKAGNQK